MSAFIETGRRTYPLTPVPPPDAAPKKVTFADLVAEVQSEASRHTHSRDTLLAMAADPAEAERMTDILEAAETRARLVEVYSALMLLVERMRDDPVILARLKVLAKEGAERDAQTNSLKKADDQ